MSQYQPPTRDVTFLLNHVFDFDGHADLCNYDCDVSTAIAIAEEAGRFAREVIDPINRPGDKQGARFIGSSVSTPDGYKEAYKAFCDAGWNGVRFSEEYGGQGLPAAVSTIVEEMWHAASIGFALCPMLTNGAAEALLLAGSELLKKKYLAKLVSGKWSGAMNLTEPQAGSDLSAISCKAVRQDDGSYLLYGQKIFITYGEHDLAENIIHLVLARTPGAPSGVRGISLFVVPKILINDDGTLGNHNDVCCASIEHKLGIHGSPTATMLFGEAGGAVGHLIGEENRGLEYMFIMMNEARYSVGLQGLSISDRAYQHALAYALERVQGKAIADTGIEGATIIRHPDVRRLLLSMKSQIEAMRALAIYVAMQKDLAHSLTVERSVQVAAKIRAELLIPIVKGWFTESAQTITYDALQIFGGMGFIEEAGAAQYFRDARILTIYEGTSAIQANDLVGRKTLKDDGAAALKLLDEIIKIGETLQLIDHPSARRFSEHLIAACDALRSVIDWMVEEPTLKLKEVYTGSVCYLKLWGMVCGGWMHAKRLQAAFSQADLSPDVNRILHSACFFADHLLVSGPAVARTIIDGGEGAIAYPDDAWLDF